MCGFHILPIVSKQNDSLPVFGRTHPKNRPSAMLPYGDSQSIRLQRMPV